MSTTEQGTDAAHGAPQLYADFPQYGLTCVVDDADEPTEVTLFPEDELERVYTQWISVDAEFAIPLEETL
jgi:hypothetical protein